MTRQIYVIAVLLFSVFQVQAQDSLATETPVQDEFTKLIEGSNNYQGYKVVDYDKLIELRNNTREYVNDLKQEIIVQKNTVDQQNKQINDLKEQLASTRNDLQKVTEEKDALMFLGMPFSKGGYKAMMWGIVGILLLLLIVLFIKFKSSHTATREARQKLKETEKEFDTYRSKALEKEQRLGRMLQDERNKTNGNP